MLLCCSDQTSNQQHYKGELHSILRDTVIPVLNARQAPCRTPCGGPGWRRIAHLNMSDPDQQCPSNWRLITTPVRACGRTSSACDSAVFPSNGASYSGVCGRINAFQLGTTDGFWNSVAGLNPGVEGPYLDGVSLTHGAAGSRQHIWTFVVAFSEPFPALNPVYFCPCSYTNSNWPYQIPSFIGNNYFCDTGNPGPGINAQVFRDNPLWDGEGCGHTSTCCQFNNPPWFCTTLPQPTIDDIELRICGNSDASSEDALVQVVDIFVI